MSARLTEAEAYPEVRDTLDVRWGGLLRSLDLLPVMVASQVQAEDYYEAMDVAAVLLTGGNDVGAVCDDALSAQRDRVDLGLLQSARAHGVPVLAVCRGFQLIASSCGGELVATPGHVATRHPLQCESGGPLGEQLAGLVESLGPVNSYHDWGIASLPPDFEVIARTQDALIEAAVDHGAKIFAQMWHPEREERVHAAQLELMKQVFSW